MLELSIALPDVLMVAQVDPDPGPAPGPATGLGGLIVGALGAFLTTLIVGGLLVTFAEDYVVRQMDAIRGEAVGSFLYGIVALLGLVVLAVLLVITIIGILLLIPLVVAAWLCWAVGSALVFLVVGERLVGRDDGWTKPLLVGAALNGALALTGIGWLVSFVVGATGFGAVLRDLL